MLNGKRAERFREAIKRVARGYEQVAAKVRLAIEKWRYDNAPFPVRHNMEQQFLDEDAADKR